MICGNVWLAAGCAATLYVSSHAVGVAAQRRAAALSAKVEYEKGITDGPRRGKTGEAAGRTWRGLVSRTIYAVAFVLLLGLFYGPGSRSFCFFTGALMMTPILNLVRLLGLWTEQKIVSQPDFEGKVRVSRWFAAGISAWEFVVMAGFLGFAAAVTGSAFVLGGAFIALVTSFFQFRRLRGEKPFPAPGEAGHWPAAPDHGAAAGGGGPDG